MQPLVLLAICVAVSLVLMAAYAFFAICTAVIIRSQVSRIQEMKEERVFCAGIADRIVDRADIYLLSMRLGGFFSVLLLGIFLADFTHRGLPWGGMSDWSPGWRWGWFGLVIFVVSLVAQVASQFLRGISPACPEKILCWLAFPIVATTWLLSPIIFILNSVLRRLLARFGCDLPNEKEAVASAEELSEIVERSTEAGEIREGESEMIESVLSSGETLVQHVMTPRKDIVSVRYTMGLAEISKLFTSESFSRLVVIGSGLDDVKGILLVKDLLPFLGGAKDAKDFNLADVCRPPYFVPGTKRVTDVLQDFRKQAVHMAIVHDEHGGVDGLVTLEDLIEEIVGEIRDEHDSPHEENVVKEARSGELIVDGSIDIDDFNERYDYQFPPGEYDTVAGFVIDRLGHLPEAGEVVEYDGVSIKVEEVEQNRITQVRISSRVSEAKESPTPGLMAALAGNSSEDPA